MTWSTQTRLSLIDQEQIEVEQVVIANDLVENRNASRDDLRIRLELVQDAGQPLHFLSIHVLLTL